MFCACVVLECNRLYFFQAVSLNGGRGLFADYFFHSRICVVHLFRNIY
jgi:hypothetical protein